MGTDLIEFQTNGLMRLAENIFPLQWFHGRENIFALCYVAFDNFFGVSCRYHNHKRPRPIPIVTHNWINGILIFNIPFPTNKVRTLFNQLSVCSLKVNLVREALGIDIETHSVK